MENNQNIEFIDNLDVLDELEDLEPISESTASELSDAQPLSSESSDNIDADFDENNSHIKLTRSEEREQAFMLLFLRSFDKDEPIDNKFVDNANLFEGGICGYSRSVVSGIDDKLDELDADISRFLKKGWSVSRISKVSLAILRLAFYEIKYVSSVPDSVSINEAVELAKKYTIDESKFINGILGSFVRSNGEAD